MQKKDNKKNPLSMTWQLPHIFHYLIFCFCYHILLPHSFIYNICLFFLDCPKVCFQNFQKTHFFRYFLQILKFGPENFGQVVILS